jgi:TonB family protein
MSQVRLVRRVFIAALLSIFCLSRCLSQDAIEAPTFSPEQQQVISDLAHHLLSDSAKANCPVTQCRILVTNFFLPSKNTCTACMAIAKAVTQEMTLLYSHVQIIPWEHLRDFLKEERISYSLLHDPGAIRWVGKQLGATQVVFGSVEPKGKILDLKVRLLDTRTVNGTKTKGRVSEFILPLGNLALLLEPREPFPLWDPQSVFEKGLLPTGDLVKAGFSPGTCQLAPNPSYSEEARDNKISGVILIEAELTPDGTIENPHVVRGLPYGLNQSVLTTSRTWRCRPSCKDGKAAASRVQFEVNFRLY